MSDRRTGHRWQPITDLPDDLRHRAFPELDGLLAVFLKHRQDLDAAKAVDAFTQRLVRSWSIETGILEDLYTLGESVTLTLVEHGFDAALLSHADSNLPAGQLIEILRDHQEAAEGLFAFVNGKRTLGTSYVKALHQVLTRHQATCDAVDSQGNFVQVPLRRGEWKVLPNNPGDRDTGEVRHQYCPPEQTESEMDRLVDLHATHVGVHFVVEAAWLHHRFTQIHPFQDGNGRVARALSSLACIRGGGLPLVVSRQQKAEYLRALESADAGSIDLLMDMFARQQREAILKAVQSADEVLQTLDMSVASVLEAARERLDAVAADDPAMEKLVDDLTAIATKRLETVAQSVAQVIGTSVRAHVMGGDLPLSMLRSVVNTQAFGGDTEHLKTKRAVSLVLRGVQMFQVVVVIKVAGNVGNAIAVVDVLRLGSVSLVGAQRPPLREWGGDPISFTVDREPGEFRATFEQWLEASIARSLDVWRRGL